MAQAERPLSLTARTESDNDPAVVEVLAKAKERTGMIPNMYALMANVPGLLHTYLDGYQAFRKQSRFSTAEQDVVLLTISRTNGCAYCMAAHSTIADMNKVPTEITDALRDGKPLPDEKLDTLSRFTATVVESRGLPRGEDLEDLFAAGYTETDVLQVVLAVSVKTLSNYANHLLHTPVDSAFEGRSWEE